MNLTKKLVATAFAVVAFAAVSQAQSVGVSETATATATIVTPISFKSHTDLKFGNIAVTSSGGTVKIDAAVADGAREKTGGITLPVITGDVARASFVVEGESNYAFSITLPEDGEVTLKHSVDATKTMPVDDFHTEVSAASTNLESGTKTFHVGATLTVSAAQPAGSYSGEFTVSVNYN